MKIPTRHVSPRKKNGEFTISNQYQKYLDKSVEEYNAKDLVFYFSDAYKRVKGIPYFASMLEDSAKMKRLLSRLDVYTLIKLIDWAIENRNDISIGMLCSSWVNTFIREAGISHPEFTKYEVLVTSPFLTDNEQSVCQDFYDKMVYASDHGDIHGEVYWKNKLDGIENEARRRKVLLTTVPEEV